MRSRIVRTALASVALVATLGLVACGDQTPATQTQDDPQEQEQVVKDPQESEQDDQTPVESQSDPADPPIATVSYEADGEEQSSEPMTCSSVWSFEQDGKTLTVTTDAPHPIEYSANGMPSVSVAEPTEITANFGEAATGVMVRRWSEMDILNSSAPINGDEVEVTLADDGSATFEVGPGYRYAMTVTFDAGEATYVFTVPSV